MSSGKIQKPSNPDLPANLTKLPMEEMIYEVIQTCPVEVEDTEWKNADTKLKEDISAVEELLKGIDGRLGKDKVDLSDELRLLKAEVEGLKARKPLDLVVKLDKRKPKDLGMQHSQLPTLIEILSAGMNVYLVGPAGSGKTHAAIQCAEALDVPFHFTGAVASEFKLTGFIDAQGRIVSTEFRKAFENGGLFLFDEIDASYPQAVLAFNAALANDYMDFPDKRVERHANFHCIAAANTYGQGADRQYVGRNQLDAASLDRFVFIDWRYDENLETHLAGNADWSSYVQRIRKFVEGERIRHVVSPRASMFGAKLLAQGLAREVVETTVLWKGMDDATRNKIIEGIEPKVQVKVDQAGRFEPVVKIGQQVKKDDAIGNLDIGDHWQREVIAVMAPRAGQVIEIIEKEGVQAGAIVATIRW
ncbi:MAG: AAA family ATPase [Flavobacteriales bacterium]|nr:AAA family ATPase [Flavobacteriales bacterium]